ncbi:type 1 glutamine amidotransferase [Thiospirillum jenense]|uniref:Type 1 glutamine amidotransferase n=1 Tax=Thiospirillum jenense TaxID=1653858 RepID=A0A839HE62_9GAMM|nr:type 1 glutamine amidotransferase [Thiospirillum jenense]MBB1127225.1 type 1 glutamine amidotransferase [Thiospirillum jenense]
MRIQVLQHVPFEGPAYLGDWATRHHHHLTINHLYTGDPCPTRDSYDWLIVLGGPMNVNDDNEHSWLTAEKVCINTAIEDGKTVIGICLGAQLIAQALGATVRRNDQQEIGWFPITWTDAAHQLPGCATLPKQLTAFHWHGDTFSLPPGAVHLATSTACQQQAFYYDGRVLGLQCHLEVTPISIAALCTCTNEDELIPAEFVQSYQELEMTAGRDFAAVHRWFDALLATLPAPPV